MNKYLYLAVSAFAVFCGTHALAQGPAGQPQANGVALPPNNTTPAWTSGGNPSITYAQGAATKHSNIKVNNNKGTNFTSYTPATINHSSEVALYNKGYENDAEAGVLYPDAPCSNCYELLGKRTETQKYFVKEGTGAHGFILQACSSPIHYKDANGKWRTITNHLDPYAGQPGVYATKGRQMDLLVNTKEGYITMQGPQGSFTYNSKLELVYMRPDGTEQSLGMANWTNYTRGDDGMRVNNIFPGMDMELTLLTNSIETNFIINAAMPAYADGKLVIRDHMLAGDGLSFENPGTQSAAGLLNIKNGAGEPVYQVQKAIAYEQNNRLTTTQDLNYNTTAGNNTVAIEIPGALLNRAASSYPIVIDPLVTGTVGPNGFTYSFSSSTYCNTTNPVVIPGGATITDVLVTYGYSGVIGSHDYEINATFSINGLCESPSMHCPGWTGTGIGIGACVLTGASCWGFGGLDAEWGIHAYCQPAFSCSAYTLPFQLHTWQSHAATAPCLQTVIATYTPFTVDVEGTVSSAEISPAGPATYCVGSTFSLSGSPSGGTWTTSDPGVATVSSTGDVATLAPGSATITYTEPAGCGSFATSLISVVTTATVSPVSATATSVCAGNTITMADPTPGGVWSSTAPGTASVDVAGTVTGVAAGTATISYTLTNPCGSIAAIKAVTVNAMPSAGTITGAPVVCVGASSLFTDGVSGGTWTSSPAAIATVSGTGSVHGVSTGTATITYTVATAFCSAHATSPVTVAVTPVTAPIAGPSGVCVGYQILKTDAAAGGVWSSSAPTIALTDSAGHIKGISAGSAVITYTITNPCGTASTTTNVTVSPVFSDHDLISTIAGDGTMGSIGDGTPATAAEINKVFGMTYDAAGNTYFVDAFNDVVRKIDPSGIVTLFAGTYGSTVSSGDGGPATFASIAGPSGIACDAAGNIYIGEVFTGNIRKVNTFGIISTFVNVSPTVSLREMTIDPSGNLYVTDEVNCRIAKIDPSGTVTNFAGNMTAGFSGDGGLATLAQLDTPTGVRADPFGNVFIADNHNNRVRMVNAAGIISTVAGTGSVGATGDGGPALSATIVPANLTSDSLGNVYVGDYLNSNVRKINMTTGIITLIAGTGFYTYTGDGILATTADVNPNCLAINHAGLLIGEYENYRIRKITGFMDGTITGPSTVCLGSTITLADTVLAGAGAWSSSNPAVATIGSTGVVTPVSLGTTTIKYKIASVCDSAVATRTVTVSVMPNPGGISGPITLCAATSVTLSDPAAGGDWYSSNTYVATVDGAGNVFGLAAGEATISYTVSSVCGDTSAILAVTVNPLPYAGSITAPVSVLCVDSSIACVDAVTGGTWGSTGGNISVAAGVATGVMTGTDTVTYSVTNSCGTAVAKYPVMVNDCTEGVSTINSGSGNFHLYPNPNPGRFTVFIPSAIAAGNADVVIRNVVGEQIQKLSVATNKEAELIINVPPGIYFLTATTIQKSMTAKITVTK